MILKHHSSSGYIKSYMEFDVVDKYGKWEDKGKYLFIRDLWVHPNYKGDEEIGIFIRELDQHKETVNVEYIYWQREKRTLKPSKLFSRKTCMRRMVNILRRKLCTA